MTTPKSHSSLKTPLLSSNSSSSQVRVVLRVRPFLPSEIDTNGGETPSSCISVLEQEHQFEEEVTVHLKDQWTSRNECYKLDSFFGQEDHVDQIFYNEVRKVIPRIFQGLNATIFAFGATGSGKTYTMQGTEDEPGLIPLAVSMILASCVNTKMRMEVSYYEVYMDRCYDLLEPKAKEIMALDDKDGRVQLKGLSCVEVHTMEEFREVFSTGVQRRKVAHTGLNDISSRSHGVLAIAITNGNAKGKLNLIDLAGNEDNRKTGNDGIRLQESAKINQSLFALSNVIYALNNNLQRIPYRESKLTRILQDSLGGTSQALMVACLNPISYQEAVHTVSLAARSRRIANFVSPASKKEAPREKVDMEAKLRAWLESKGKTKSLQRTRIFSPSSINCSKNSGSVKAKPTGRRLFDSGVPSTTTMEEISYFEVGDSEQDKMLCDLLFKSNNDKDVLESSEIIYPYGYDRDQDDMHLNNCSFPKDANFGRCTTTPNGNTQIDKLQNENFSNQISEDTEGQWNINTDINISKASNLPDANFGRCTTTPNGNSQIDKLQNENFSNQISEDTEGQWINTDINISKPSNLPDANFGRCTTTPNGNSQIDKLQNENFSNQISEDTEGQWINTDINISKPSNLPDANFGRCTTTPNGNSQIDKLQNENFSNQISEDTEGQWINTDINISKPSNLPDANFGRCTTTPNGNRQIDKLQNEIFSNQISEDTEDQWIDTDINISKPSNLPDTPYNKENLQYPIITIRSPAMSEEMQEPRHSIRKVLSLIPSNVATNIVLLEPKTPRTPCVVLTCNEDEVQTSDTQLSKFSALSSNLKESLVEKYLAFLNAASKEELLQLKGIGERRAEYILNLREQMSEPLKSLSDLEKLGLTSRQVDNMFKRAARGFFA